MWRGAARGQLIEGRWLRAVCAWVWGGGGGGAGWWGGGGG